MTAQDYPINFPYGVTDAPYGPTHPHRGDDRPCPAGTPVVINGTQLGLTGATGFVFGPHLHIQEWHGDYATTRKPQNAFQPGTVVNIDLDGTQGDGSFGKFITIKTADGWCDTYCHLSQIDVHIGQEIGDLMASHDVVDETTIKLEFNNALLRDASPGDVSSRIAAGQTVEGLQRELQASDEHNRVITVFELGSKAEGENWQQQIADLQKEVADLKAAKAQEQATPDVPPVSSTITTSTSPGESVTVSTVTPVPAFPEIHQPEVSIWVKFWALVIKCLTLNHKRNIK